MNRKLLSLIPSRFLCPYCGKWHKWDKSYKLEYYDSELYYAEFECPNVPSGCCNKGNYRIYFRDDYCYYSTDRMCDRAKQSINGKIAISSIIESTDEPIATFDVPFTAESYVGRKICGICQYKDECICVKLGDEGDNIHMTITFGFEFEQSDYNQFSKRTENKEGNTMANVLNMNMEFGHNKDENIASTFMGVAVKNGDSWRIYDKKKKEITDVGDMQLGNLPIFILPTTKLSEGDLIKEAGEYYFVTKVATPEMPIQTLSARTGEMKSIVPIKNILGFSCYSKVIALSDSLNIGDDFDVEKLAVMSAVCEQTGEDGGQMNQLLLLLLFKDRIREDDDTMKLLLMSSMMNSAEDSGQMNQFLPLLFFKDRISEDDDTMKLLLMSSMMGGNTSGYNNLLTNYLMLDTFMGKKEDKAPQKTVEGTEE